MPARQLALAFCTLITVVVLTIFPARSFAARHKNAATTSMSAHTPGTKFSDCPHCPEMILIPPGHFIMGTSLSEDGYSDREGPQRAVNIQKAFAVGIFDVTRDEYAAFVKQTGWSGRGCHFFDGKRWAIDPRKDWRNPGFPQTGRDPVVCVSWDEAHVYLRWLNSQVPGEPYRLLSEAEWEYVARGGTVTPYYWGSQASHDDANYGLEQCYPCGIAKQGRDQWYYTSPVGSFPPNAFGLYDVSGNVWQWTEDCMHYSFVGAPSDGSPWTTGDCRDRVLRGGSWLDNAQTLRIAIRNPWPPEDRNNANGFRVARSSD